MKLVHPGMYEKTENVIVFPLKLCSFLFVKLNATTYIFSASSIKVKNLYMIRKIKVAPSRRNLSIKGVLPECNKANV